MEYILIFIATIIVDIAWTLYLIKVEERKPVQSGFWAVVIYLMELRELCGIKKEKKIWFLKFNLISL